MKRSSNFIFVCVVAGSISAGAVNLPSDWQHEQSFDISTNGLIKISLPVETLDSARPALEDLRLYDDAGNEIPYLIEHPKPPAKIVQPARSFQVSLNPGNTVIILETGLSGPVDAITLESPAANFIKAVGVEISDDGQNWRPLAQGKPIFRQLTGAENLKILFPPSAAKWLRLTVDDSRSQPVPFIGARIETYSDGSALDEMLTAVISEHDENPGETRLAINLGAANLDVASVQIETAEPLFTRPVVLAVPQISEDSIREQTIGRGTIYRVAVEGQTPAENLSVPLEKTIRSRELILFIKNGDSPPLPVKSVSVERRPVYLVFLARQSGLFHLLTGNTHCEAPRYDLSELNMDLKSVAVAPIKIPPPKDNPDYRAPEVLSGVEIAGAPLDTAAWKFRKPIKISNNGAQQMELDLNVLSHADAGFADLRVMNGSNQVPYIIERTSISRVINPVVTVTNQTKPPGFSRWNLKLPQADLPIARISCVAKTALFERTMALYELVTDDRGETLQRMLMTYPGSTWTQTPERKNREFALTLDNRPQTDSLVLETQNGDNPPVELDDFKVFYPATKILFKAKSDDDLFLYYGNPNVAPPRYDLNLVANQLLAADKKAASAGDEQQLKKTSWRENQIPGKGGILFWGILALVVIVLLVIISRLLPKSPVHDGN